MLKNYLKVGIRNLLREKGYTLIHVISLALGIGCFLFLLLLYQYATHFDTFHTKSDRIYRVIDHIKNESGDQSTDALTPMPWAPAMESSFPQIEKSVRFLLLGKRVQRDNESFNTGVTYTDSAFFKVFSFPLAKGNAKTALNGPNKAVLTQETSRMLFGNDDPLNKYIRIEKKNYKITGVLKKIPAQSSLSNNFSLLVSTDNLNSTNFSSIHDWSAHTIESFVLLKKGVDVSIIENQLSPFLKKHLGEERSKNYSPSLQPLPDMYLGGWMNNDYHDTLDKNYIYIFLTIGFMILIISCINFINISTARASKRNREVGLRKVIGASGGQLIFQYLFEVFMITVVALVLANILIEFILPIFNALSDWRVQIDYPHNSFLWVSVIAILFFVTITAGGYPAFYLSRFRPARIFRNMSSGNTKSFLRSGLVVSQFTLAVFMLFCALVVKKQIHFLFHKDLGFQKEGVLRILHSGSLSEAHQFRNEIRKNPMIREVSLASNGPFSPGELKSFTVQRDNQIEEYMLHTFFVDEHYIPLLDLKVNSGRNFNNDLATDTTQSVIINEAAVNKFGWQGNDAVGRTIITKTQNGINKTLTVIGVIQNFNYEALDQPVRPLILLNQPDHFTMMVVKVDPTQISAATQFINQTWKKDFSGQFIYYQFVQSQIKQWYETESIISQMLSFITYLTAFIACLGLLGLASYSTLQRLKEISVRKVLGAKVGEIVVLLSMEFMKYVGLGLLIGLPLAWYAVNLWLNNFVYHANIGLTPILTVILATVIVGWLTICWQTIRAALANPVDNLNNE